MWIVPKEVCDFGTALLRSETAVAEIGCRCLWVFLVLSLLGRQLDLLLGVGHEDARNKLNVYGLTAEVVEEVVEVRHVVDPVLKLKAKLCVKFRQQIFND